MFHGNRKSLLALLLSTVLVAVQTALPWMHVGCQHDHSVSLAGHDGHAHKGCRHHHHHRATQQRSDSVAAIDKDEHSQALSDDCAACRFLLVSSARCEPAAAQLTEQVSVLSAELPVVAWRGQPVGLYRSRAPPTLG